MVDRKVQKITSPFGNRIINGQNQFHPGVDLRVFNFTNWKKQRILFPCECEILRIGYQEMWGWNVIAKPLYGNYTELKFVHLHKPECLEKEVYRRGEFLGWTTVTPYMKLKGFGEHLHFETWIGEPVDPVKFFDEQGISYE